MTCKDAAHCCRTTDRADRAAAAHSLRSARVIVVLPLCGLANRFRTSRISGRVAATLVFAGLRGAIAFALAKNVESAHRGTITGATTAIVL
eukprot:1605389-Prymnesium_polylepis.1